MHSTDFVKEIITKNPVLPASEQLMLLRQWQNNADKMALDKLVLCNMKIVSKEASKIKSRNYYISYEDLMQEGMAGLLKAADMFDTTQDVNFLTYAMWWIKANMKKYVMEYKSVVKMGTTRDDRTLFSNLSKSVKEAEDLGLSGEDMLCYISRSLSVKKSSLERMMTSLKSSDVRLDTPISSSHDGSETLGIDLLEDPTDYQKSFEDINESLCLKAALEDILPNIPDLERKVVEGRFMSDEPKTLRELESDLGVSREWVRKIEIKALDRIRKRLKVSYGLGKDE